MKTALRTRQQRVRHSPGRFAEMGRDTRCLSSVRSLQHLCSSSARWRMVCNFWRMNRWVRDGGSGRLMLTPLASGSKPIACLALATHAYFLCLCTLSSFVFSVSFVTSIVGSLVRVCEDVTVRNVGWRPGMACSQRNAVMCGEAMEG